ncbi:MAG: S-layer protein domain-containing protein [Methanosarcina sp.]
MKPYIEKFLLSTLAVFLIFLILAPSGFAAPPAPVIRGYPFDTNETASDGFIWNATTFGAFNYPVNKHKDFVASENWWGERLQYIEKDGQNELGKNNPANHVIGEEELVYSTRQFSNKYELVSDLELNPKTTPEKMGGMFYYKLAWFGKPYVTVENDATQIANIVITQIGDEKKELKAGDVWDLGKSYSLQVHQVDVEGEKVWFSLYKNGYELESGIINADGSVSDRTFTASADFGDGKDQLYFITYVDSVFVSATDSFAVFKYTWLIDKDEVIILEKGDEYQGFEIEETSKDGIVLANLESITLNLDKDVKNYFTDSWYFQTSDAGKGSTSPQGYIIYPAMDINLEEKGGGSGSGSGVTNNTAPKGETNLTGVNSTDANMINNTANNLTEMNITGNGVNLTGSENRSSETSEAPVIQGSFENPNSQVEGNSEEENEGKTVMKSPGFEVFFGIAGIGLSKAFLKRRIK